MSTLKHWCVTTVVAVLLYGMASNTDTAAAQAPQTTKCAVPDMGPDCQDLAARFIALIEFPLRQLPKAVDTVWRMTDAETGRTTCRIKSVDVPYGARHQMSVRCQSAGRSEVWAIDQETLRPYQLMMIRSGDVHAVSFLH